MRAVDVMFGLYGAGGLYESSHLPRAFRVPLMADESVRLTRSAMELSRLGAADFVNVYVSGEDIRFQDGLETSLADGDEVTILPAVAGGR